MTPYDNPDYHAFVRRIRDIDRDGGDSSLARLVVADWLEEREEGEYAAWIRAHVESVRPWVSAVVYDTLPLGAATMQDVRGGIMSCQMPPDFHTRDGATDLPSPSFLVRCGFVESVECPLAWWLAHGPAVCRRHPVRDFRIMRAGYGNTLQALYAESGASVARMPAVGTPFFRFVRLRNSRVLEKLDDRFPVEYMTRLNADALRWAESEADR